VQPIPFLPLCFIGRDLRVERLGDAAHRDAPLRLDHELLLQPQLLLEVHLPAQEVALGVVAAEEAEQVVVNLTLQRAHVHGVALEPGAQVVDLWGLREVHARGLDARDDLGQLLLDLGLVGGLVLAERRLHLRQQVLLEELRHLGALGVHDAVEAEVQVGLIELKQLLQQGLQLFVVLTHMISGVRFSVFGAQDVLIGQGR
jgi:hypothetical protein